MSNIIVNNKIHVDAPQQISTEKGAENVKPKSLDIQNPVQPSLTKNSKERLADLVLKANDYTTKNFTVEDIKLLTATSLKDKTLNKAYGKIVFYERQLDKLSIVKVGNDDAKTVALRKNYLDAKHNLINEIIAYGEKNGKNVGAMVARLQSDITITKEFFANCIGFADIKKTGTIIHASPELRKVEKERKYVQAQNLMTLIDSELKQARADGNKEIRELEKNIKKADDALKALDEIPVGEFAKGNSKQVMDAMAKAYACQDDIVRNLQNIANFTGKNLQEQIDICNARKNSMFAMTYAYRSHLKKYNDLTPTQVMSAMKLANIEGSDIEKLFNSTIEDVFDPIDQIIKHAGQKAVSKEVLTALEKIIDNNISKINDKANEYTASYLHDKTVSKKAESKDSILYKMLTSSLERAKGQIVELKTFIGQDIKNEDLLNVFNKTIPPLGQSKVRKRVNKTTDAIDNILSTAKKFQMVGTGHSETIKNLSISLDEAIAQNSAAIKAIIKLSQPYKDAVDADKENKDKGPSQVREFIKEMHKQHKDLFKSQASLKATIRYYRGLGFQEKQALKVLVNEGHATITKFAGYYTALQKISPLTAEQIKDAFSYNLRPSTAILGTAQGFDMKYLHKHGLQDTPKGSADNKKFIINSTPCKVGNDSYLFQYNGQGYYPNVVDCIDGVAMATLSKYIGFDCYSQCKVGVLDNNFGLFTKVESGNVAKNILQSKRYSVGQVEDGTKMSLLKCINHLASSGKGVKLIENLLEKYCELEWMDFLVGNVSRSSSGYLLSINPDTAEVKVTGFDNQQLQQGEKEITPPVFITHKVYDKIMNITPDAYNKMLKELYWDSDMEGPKPPPYAEYLELAQQTAKKLDAYNKKLEIGKAPVDIPDGISVTVHKVDEILSEYDKENMQSILFRDLGGYIKGIIRYLKNPNEY